MNEAIAKLDAFCLPETADTWDSPGYLVQLSDKTELTGVVIAMDVAQPSLQAAKGNGANLLFTHHPVFLKAPQTYGEAYSEASYAGRLVGHALVSRIGLYAAHTNLDKNVKAVDANLSYLHLKRVNELTLDGYGAYIDCTCSVQECAEQLSERTGSFAMYSEGKKNIPTKTLFLPGSARSFINEALQHKVDLLITGEVDYHNRLQATEEGMAVITLGHGLSEAGYLPYMRELVVRLLGSDIPVFMEKVINFNKIQRGNYQ